VYVMFVVGLVKCVFVVGGDVFLKIFDWEDCLMFVCFKCVVWFGDVLMFECNVEIVCGLVGCGKVKVIVDG